MEKEDIKKVIDEYYVHLQLYVLLAFSKLEQIKGMSKKNLEHFQLIFLFQVYQLQLVK